MLSFSAGLNLTPSDSKTFWVEQVRRICVTWRSSRHWRPCIAKERKSDMGWILVLPPPLLFNAKKNVHPCMFWGSRLGCSWQQSSKSLNKICFGTTGKETVTQKPGNNAKSFGLSQVAGGAQNREQKGSPQSTCSAPPSTIYPSGMHVTLDTRLGCSWPQSGEARHSSRWCTQVENSTDTNKESLITCCCSRDSISCTSCIKSKVEKCYFTESDIFAGKIEQVWEHSCSMNHAWVTLPVQHRNGSRQMTLSNPAAVGQSLYLHFTLDHQQCCLWTARGWLAWETL